MPSAKVAMKDITRIIAVAIILTAALTSAQTPPASICPWPEDMTDLHEACTCSSSADADEAVSPSSDVSQTIVCTNVNTGRLLGALRGSLQAPSGRPAAVTPGWHLRIVNSSVPILLSNTFAGLPVRRLEIDGCRLRHVHADAFAGLERRLTQLRLANNWLTDVPAESFGRLRVLQTLSLAGNRITAVPEAAFAPLSTLHTLDLSDNNVTRLHSGAFQGLELSLRTLLLKNVRHSHVPVALSGLAKLSFLDLSQNYLASLPPRAFASLDTLTALNLERNLIQTISERAFDGVNDSLTSLSLLNNLLAEFPTNAIAKLTNLRVLDAGFNLISSLQRDSLASLQSLTLLALDGNPISTLPESVFTPVRQSLRGLSLGGRFLRCDCRMRWVVEWMRDSELQVTSRERRPQFCGHPAHLRDRTLYQLNADEMVCEEKQIESNVATSKRPTTTPSARPTEEARLPTTTRVPLIQATLTTTANVDMMTVTVGADLMQSKTAPVLPTATRVLSTTTTTTPATITGSRRPTAEVHVTNRHEHIAPSSTSELSVFRPLHTRPLVQQQAASSRSSLLHPPPPPPRRSPNLRFSSTPSPQQPPPQIVFRQPGVRAALGRSETAASSSRRRARGQEVRVLEAYRRDHSVVIQWDSDVDDILGFRVVYRLFGDSVFKQGPPLAASEREFKIKNVPARECIVVCVVSLEDIQVTPDTVSPRQCREIRTDPPPPAPVDTFVIAASAAICATIVLAVLVFVCCNRQRRRRRSEKQHLPAILATTPASGGGGTGAGGTVGMMGIGPPLASLGSMRVDKDWDQMSVYSQRSIPRARMYHTDRGSVHNGFGAEETRGALARASSRRRSMLERQSLRSYSALSASQLPALSSSHALALPRPELRASRASLASGYLGHGGAASLLADSLMDSGGGGGGEERRRARRLSRSHSRLSNGGRYLQQQPPPQPATTGDDTDGWTDHDMDIYMTTNAAATRDTNLVQL